MANNSEFFIVDVVDCNVEKKRSETRFLCLHSCVGADWERRCTALNILKEEKMKRTGKNALEPDSHLPAKMCFSKFMRILQLYNEELSIMHIIYGVLLILLIESSYAGHILHISDIHLDLGILLESQSCSFFLCLEYHEGASSECWFKFFGCCHPTTIPFKHYSTFSDFQFYSSRSSWALWVLQLQCIPCACWVHIRLDPKQPQRINREEHWLHSVYWR